MNFHALLFCQDEKTARVTTQLLNELEFSVETSSEPFAAVKKLMGQHFDAVVVDCDDEQNASLLFKGAHNSTLNQSSLAVAVVEGQAGVANAFRIGANLVLTKPINIEQAKGTLRVARGLLKKGGETAKPAAATAPSTSAPPAKPVGTNPAAPRPTTPIAAVSTPARMVPPAKAMPAAAMAKSAAGPGNVLEVDTESAGQAEDIVLDSLEEHSPSAQLVGKTEVKPVGLIPAPLETAHKPAKDVQRPLTVSGLSAGGAASAPAPAKAPVKLEFEKIGDPGIRTGLHVPTAAAPSSATAEAPGPFSQRQSVPTFAALDSADSGESGGAGKFAAIVIIVLALAAGAYFAYSKLHKPASSLPSQSQPQPTPTSESEGVPANSPSITSPAKPSASVVERMASAEVTAPAPRKSETASSADTEPEVVVTKIEPEPRVVKANPSTTKSVKSNDVEEQAPSALAAAPSDESEISQIVSSAPVAVPTAAPAEMLKVSQGVTQGLLLKRVQPVYPHQALQMRIAGSVQLVAVINKSGNISSVKALSGDPILARAAVEAVSQWKYKPYTLNGEPVDIQTQITVNFKLP